MKSREAFRRFLTQEEKEVFDTLPQKERRLKVAECWKRFYAVKKENKFERSINLNEKTWVSNVEFKQMENVAIQEAIVSEKRSVVNAKGASKSRLDIKGDGTQDDWKEYATESELAACELLGRNHPESVSILLKCIGRRYYYRKKIKKIKRSQRKRIIYNPGFF